MTKKFTVIDTKSPYNEYDENTKHQHIIIDGPIERSELPEHYSFDHIIYDTHLDVSYLPEVSRILFYGEDDTASLTSFIQALKDKNLKHDNTLCVTLEGAPIEIHIDGDINNIEEIYFECPGFNLSMYPEESLKWLPYPYLFDFFSKAYIGDDHILIETDEAMEALQKLIKLQNTEVIFM